jgi:hypothetical protein
MLFTAARNPRCNGLVERLHACIKEQLRTLYDYHRGQWVQLLQSVVFAYNTSVHSSTNYTPYFVLFGREATTPGLLLSKAALENASQDFLDEEGNVVAYVSDQLRLMRETNEQVQAQLASKREAAYDDYKRKVHVRSYQVGDLVWLASDQDARVTGTRSLWIGPCPVTTVLSEFTYIVNVPQPPRKNGTIAYRSTTANLRRLRPCRLPTDGSKPKPPHSPPFRFSEPSPLVPPTEEEVAAQYEDDDDLPAAADSRESPVPMNESDPEKQEDASSPEDDAAMSDVDSEEEQEEKADSSESNLPSSAVDPFSDLGLHAPAPADDLPPAAADTPAGRALARHRGLARPDYSDAHAAKLPVHDHLKRYSLPPRQGTGPTRR